MLTCEDLVDLYRAEQEPPPIIVLSGGSPGLIPEWRLWMMDALESAGLDQATYLWSDDDLSSQFMLEELSAKEIDRLQRYRNYGQVCCFKGFDPVSFDFNCRAGESHFRCQIELMDRFLDLEIDIYCYVTLTSPEIGSIRDGLCHFMDDLQQLSECLPLRTIPLEIKEFTPVTKRGISDRQRLSFEGQQHAIDSWNLEIERRFSSEMIRKDITEIPLRSRR